MAMTMLRPCRLVAIGMVALPSLASAPDASIGTATRNRRVPDFSHTIGREECPNANHLKTCYDLEAYNLFDECDCIEIGEGQGVSFVCMQGDYLWCEGRSETTSEHQSLLTEDGLGMDDISLPGASSSSENKRQIQTIRVSVAAVIGVALLTLLVRSVSRRQRTVAQEFPTSAIDAEYRDGDGDDELGGELEDDNVENDNEEGKIGSQEAQSSSTASQIELATFT